MRQITVAAFTNLDSVMPSETELERRRDLT